MNSRFCSKTRWQMFLLVSVRHVGAHPNGHHHAVFMQISINLAKTFLRISSIWNIALTWILARVFAYLPPFIFQILDLICWTVLIFISIYFEWRETENQQFYYVSPCFPVFSPVFLCFPLFSSVFPCFLLFSPVFLRFPMFPYVLPCFLLLPVLPRLSMFSHVSLSFLLISYVFLCFPLFSYVSPFFPSCSCFSLFFLSPRFCMFPPVFLSFSV